MAVTINGSTGVTYSDNIKHKYGTGEDLEIYHDGSNSIIKDDGIGDLQLRAENFRVQNKEGTESCIHANANAAVELYYNGVKKFETNQYGNKSYQHLYMDDSHKLQLGSSQDLQIYHDGNNSIIDENGTGSLFVKSSTFYVNSPSGEDMISAVADGAVSLYYDNSKKLETYTDGVLLDGHARPGTTDIHDLGSSTHKWRNIWMENDLYIEDNGMAVLGTGEDFKIYHRSSDDMNILEVGNQHILFNVNGSGRVMMENSGVFYTHDARPFHNDSYDLGSSGTKWDDVYATNGTIQTSDKNEKNTIVDTDLGLSFVNKLKPVSYKFNGKTRTHYGLIAQDVETTLSDISKPTTDFAGFIKEDVPEQVYDAIKDEGNIPEGKKVGDVKKDAYTSYGLRYGEFISPLIKAVQELSAEVETLKTKVAALEAHTHE